MLANSRRGRGRPGGDAISSRSRRRSPREKLQRRHRRPAPSQRLAFRAARSSSPEELERGLIDRLLWQTERLEDDLSQVPGQKRGALERQLELAKSARFCPKTRPPGCWCLVLGGHGRTSLPHGDEPIAGWRVWCRCPDGQAMRRSFLARAELRAPRSRQPRPHVGSFRSRSATDARVARLRSCHGSRRWPTRCAGGCRRTAGCTCTARPDAPRRGAAIGACTSSFADGKTGLLRGPRPARPPADELRQR